jgi:hypothetical protein
LPGLITCLIARILRAFARKTLAPIHIPERETSLVFSMRSGR